MKAIWPAGLEDPDNSIKIADGGDLFRTTSTEILKNDLSSAVELNTVTWPSFTVDQGY
jgi:hypothetical protein